MGPVSGMEISSPPKISPWEEELGRQGFSSHRVILR